MTFLDDIKAREHDARYGWDAEIRLSYAVVYAPSEDPAYLRENESVPGLRAYASTEAAFVQRPALPGAARTRLAAAGELRSRAGAYA